MNDKLTPLPGYSREEERINMITHIIGGGLGLIAMFAITITAAYNQNYWGIVSGIIYGVTMLLLFTASSIYHGLETGRAKLKMRIFDRCAIYALIAGTYTPMLVGALRDVYPGHAWTMFGILWGMAVIGIVLSAAQLRGLSLIPVVCYVIMGWLPVVITNRLISVYGGAFFALLITGGILYTVGVIFYALGKRKKYMHSVFHVFVLGGSVFHSSAILLFVV